MSIKLNINDEVITKEGYLGVVTKINDKTIWFGTKRYSLEKLLKEVTSVLYQNSPDIKVDWTNPKESKDYYLSFKRWSFYISGGCKYTNELCEIKNGLAFHNGEYYVPCPRGTHDDWRKKDETDIKDGLYYVRLYKRVTGYYSHQGGEIINVFSIQETTSAAEQESLNLRKSWDYYNTPKEQSIEHIKKLDLTRILVKELNFIKDNVGLFFKEHLPFKASNGVCINTWNGFISSLSCSKGLLYIDNYYRGCNPSGLDHGLMFKFHPSFSNEMRYYASSDIKEFSAKALEQIAVQIEKSVKSYCSF